MNLAWFSGGGEMGALMRAKDWAGTPLGAPETWSQSIKTAVSICLNSRFPILLWIGPELRILYNDTYIPFLGETKHPAALGAAGREVWGEIWSTVGPMHEEVAAGRATSVEDQQMFFARRLPREEVYVTFGYSPILAPDGVTIEGVFCACTETTTKVIGERRLATLRALGARSPKERTADVACQDAAEVLRCNPLDVPFATIYLLEEDGKSARYAGGTRLSDRLIFPENHPVFETSSSAGPWPLRRVAESGSRYEVSDLPGTIGIFQAGAWSDAITTAVVLPLSTPGQPRPAGFLIVGVSPRRIFDADYRGFFDLVAGHIAVSIADARALEVERARAEGLAELDRVKTAFFSNVSHEFRTPLTLMLGPIEEILAKAPSTIGLDNRGLLEVAHRNSLRLLRLVNTLLDFSRVEAGRMQASYEPVDLASLTADLASSFRSACERAGLRLDVQCPPLQQPAYVDRDMWEKIVLNLISNAFKFTLQGRIEVAVHADGGNAVVSVKDTGVGISEAELPYIFERFHRIGGQRGRTHEGTGIGLALVHELVRLHKGKVSVESKEGQGTTFVVKVPFGQNHLPVDRVQASSLLDSTAIGAGPFVEEALRWLPLTDASSVSETILDSEDVRRADVASDGKRSRVLLVDDNADMREHLVRLLARWWDVESASDGLTALEAMRKTRPDLVLADIMMPRLDGIGLLSALRADPDLAEIPVILLSARTGEEARIEGLRVGADDYLLKPFSARELIARVQSHLSLSRIRSEHAAALVTLHKISMRLTATSDLESVLWEVLDATIELQQAQFGDIQLYDKTSGALRIVAHRGVDQRFLDYFAAVDASDTSACGLALKAGARVIVEDVNTNADYLPHREIAALTGYRGVQSTTLLHPHTGKPIGMLSTMFRQPYRPSHRELQLTDLYARQGANVIASRMTQQALRESEARLQAAVELVNLGCYAWNPQTNELQWDDSLRAMWGLPSDAAVDYEIWRAGVHPDDLERVLTAIDHCMDPRSDGLYDIEYRVIGRDRVERWIATRGRTNFKDEKPISFEGVALDISARKQVEHILEQRVQNRTRELAQVNQQLRAQIEQRQKAEAAVEQLQRLDAIGQMTSGMAHDFNNLLSVILMNTKLLLRAVRDADQQEGLELVRSAAEKGANLTKQLLAFSRKQRLEPQIVDLNSKLAGMRDLLRATLGARIELKVRANSSLWRALVDPTQIELVVLNLAINARDAMAGQGSLIVETFNTVIDADPLRPEDPSPGNYVAIAVSDTGIGIPGDVLPHVFEPFFSTKEAGKGSGLGLAQVFGIAKQSGGGVCIDTRVGEGTTVSVFFPSGEMLPLGEESDAIPAIVEQLTTSAHILVVDDDKDVLKSTLRLLQALGFSVLGARSGSEALQQLAGNPEIDLIVAEFAMPEMNGIDLAGTVSRLRPSLPFILMTANGEIDPLKEIGRMRILPKPWTDSELAEEIRQALS
jgi:PAS domain S-box-containing protein